MSPPIRSSCGASLGLWWSTLTVLFLLGIHTRLYPLLFVFLLLSVLVSSPPLIDYYFKSPNWQRRRVIYSKLHLRPSYCRLFALPEVHGHLDFTVNLRPTMHCVLGRVADVLDWITCCEDLDSRVTALVWNPGECVLHCIAIYYIWICSWKKQ